MDDLPLFGDPDVARALKRELGVGELYRLRGLMAGAPVCASHPSSGHEAGACPCRTSAATARHLDAAEQRQCARDGVETGLTAGQREALLAGLAAMFAAGAAAKLAGGDG
jgi:hypothetical protein